MNDQLQSNSIHGLRMTLVVLTAFCAACTKTKVTSVVTPEAKIYDRVLVVFPLADIRDREVTEQEFAGLHPDWHTTFIPSVKLFRPGTHYEASWIMQVLDDQGIDGVLLFLPPDDMHFKGQPRDLDALLGVLNEDPLGVTLTRVLNDPTQVSTFSSHPPPAQRRDEPLQPHLPVRRTGSPDPWTRYAASLRDATSGHVAWVAAARSSSPLNTAPHTLLRSIAKKTVDQLRADGMIR